MFCSLISLLILWDLQITVIFVGAGALSIANVFPLILVMVGFVIIFFGTIKLPDVKFVPSALLNTPVDGLRIFRELET